MKNLNIKFQNNLDIKAIKDSVFEIRKNLTFKEMDHTRGDLPEAIVLFLGFAFGLFFSLFAVLFYDEFNVNFISRDMVAVIAIIIVFLITVVYCIIRRLIISKEANKIRRYIDDFTMLDFANDDIGLSALTEKIRGFEGFEYEALFNSIIHKAVNIDTYLSIKNIHNIKTIKSNGTSIRAYYEAPGDTEYDPLRCHNTMDTIRKKYKTTQFGNLNIPLFAFISKGLKKTDEYDKIITIDNNWIHFLG